MNTKSTLNVLFLFFITSHAFAIDPAYEGVDGIREKIFAPYCLSCHSSNLADSARNGAPASVNLDTYEAALPNAERSVVIASDQTPFLNGLPLLNEEQINAMVAWQAAGFPRAATAATYSYESTILTLPVVNVGNQKFNAILRLTPLNNSPTGVGFVLERAELITASSENAATFHPETGQTTLPFVELVQNGSGQGHVSAELALVPRSNPLLFILTSYSGISTVQ